MIRPEQYNAVKAMLDMWANQITSERSNATAKGYPTQSIGAPDARIHSVEDMEIEDDKRIVSAVDTAIWDLPVMERNAVYMHYGLMEFKVWRAEFDTVFDLAIENLFLALKSRVVC